MVTVIIMQLIKDGIADGGEFTVLNGDQGCSHSRINNNCWSI